MKRYPDIINIEQATPTSATLNLFIPNDVVFFQGHFPARLVLPGVVQIDWVIFFAQKYFCVALQRPPRMEHVKFTNIIKPETKLFLTMQLDGSALSFKYFADQVIYSVGKITL